MFMNNNGHGEDKEGMYTKNALFIFSVRMNTVITLLFLLLYNNPNK